MEDTSPYIVISFHAAYDRIRQILDVRTQGELAAALGIQQSSISDAKRRGRIPASWLIELSLSQGVSPAWILSGSEPHNSSTIRHSPMLKSRHVVRWSTERTKTRCRQTVESC